MTEKKVFVKCASHRAREYLLSLTPPSSAHYHIPTLFDSYHKGIYLIPEALLDDARKIKGITKCRDQNPENYGWCW